MPGLLLVYTPPTARAVRRPPDRDSFYGVNDLPDLAVRDGEWKLVMETKRRNSQRELYNLTTDPSETTDVIDRHPQVAEKLLEKLNAIIRNGRSSSGPPQSHDTAWWDDLVWMEPF